MRELKGKLIIVSNRLPVSVSKSDGRLEFKPSTGGLATAMSKLSQRSDTVWVGWPGIGYDSLTPKERKHIIKELKKYRCHPVFLKQKQVDLFYSGYSNSTIWPLFHYHPTKVVNDKDNWEAYKEVNRMFADVIGSFKKNAEQVWVHDYHLMLLPGLLRERLPKTKIGFFLHTPFPSYEVFRLLPEREEILRGLIGADLLGFHTYDYVRHFLSSVLRALGYKSSLGTINVGARLVKADTFPIGIDYPHFAQAAKRKFKAKLKKTVFKFGTKIILSFDRNDYTKGIIERLDAYDLFLKSNPKYRGKVVMVLISAPSRTGVAAYKDLQHSVEQKISHINGEYGRVGWSPISYQHQTVPFDKLVDLFIIGDVMLVTPLRDGMNLIAKEYVATRQNGRGVLVLSERAGAASELQESLLVNPNDTGMVAAAIKQALEMPVKEQRSRLRPMQNRIASYTSDKWAKDFLQQLELAGEKRAQSFEFLMPSDKRVLLKSYNSAENRLILLDYDGTINEFVQNPSRESGRPDKNLKKLLKKLADNKRNRVVIISGRTKLMLESWFSDLKVDLIAEHGVWIKTGKHWIKQPAKKGKWFKQCKDLLTSYAERTPGAIVEEKDMALVWHYRAVPPDLAYVRRRELKSGLMDIIGNNGVGIFEGDKILEIKSKHIHKGTVTRQLLSDSAWDFVLAMGDDYTDEDMFRAMPQSAYPIKIGLQPTEARFRLDSVKSALSLLEDLA